MRKPRRSAAKRSAATKRSAAAKRPTPRKPALELLRDPRLKKIYVYSEGTFVLHNAAEIKETRHQDAGFRRQRLARSVADAAGRHGGKRSAHVGHGKWQWSGPKLLALGDMTNRLNYLSGTHIEIWVQQTTSFDNFAKPVEYAYQFVVESQ